MIRRSTALALAALLLAPSLAAAQLGSDYYYHAPTITERYVSNTAPLVEADAKRRQKFVAGIVGGLLTRPHPLSFAIFAIGDRTEELVIVSRQEGQLDAPCRARAMHEVMTVIARASRTVGSFGLDESVTFLDIANMLGFSGVTISDGADYTHHFSIASPDQLSARD